MAETAEGFIHEDTVYVHLDGDAAGVYSIPLLAVEDLEGDE